MRGNTVRLRLTQSEVAKFDETGSVEETVEFPSGNLIYELRRGLAYFADFQDRKLTVTVPESQARLWVESSQVGMEAQAGTVDLLIEKDFQCVHGPADADAFLPEQLS